MSKLKGSGKGRVRAALESVLQPEGFRVVEEVPAHRLVERGVLFGAWAARDAEALGNHRFDFVVYDPDGDLAFVIEFDGPCHDQRRRQIQDIRKNRLCWAAGIKLVRLGADDVRPRDGNVAPVDFMLRRHLEWRRWSADPESTSVVHEDDDPSILFDLERPMPESVRKAQYLWDEHRIFSNLLPPETWAAEESRCHSARALQLDYGGRFDREESPFRWSCVVRRNLILTTPTSDGRRVQLIEQFTRRVEYRIALRVFDNPWSWSPGPIMFPAIPRVREAYSIPLGLAGATPSECAFHFAEYALMLGAVLWAQENRGRLRACLRSAAN